MTIRCPGTELTRESRSVLVGQVGDRHDAGMRGLMQDTQLTVNMIFARGRDYWGRRQIATKRVDGIERSTFADTALEVLQVATALDALGVSADGRVGSFAWNTRRHLVLYFAVPMTGRVLHTGNIRLFPDQLVYTMEHAEDEVVFVDRSLLPLFAKFLPMLKTVKHVVVFDDGAPHDLPDDHRVITFDQLLAEAIPADAEQLAARLPDENTAAGICYTTGTTGNPKGVVYSHRSTYLHTLGAMLASTLALTDADTVLPVVPMFHANAWGIPYAAWLAGSNIVMPGPDMSPAGLLGMLSSEKVTVTAGVPTIWMGMVPMLKDHDLSSLRRVMSGGSAMPKSLSEKWREAIGLPVMQGWGMTEISPVGSMSTLRAEYLDADPDTQADIRSTQGMSVVGVEWRVISSETGLPQPWDGASSGELEVRGPWVARQYYRTPEPGPQFSADGWLRTGDVAVITPDGYMRIVDRTKDLVKSGGEWISSVDLENEIMGHPDVAEAAVIGLPHPKWGERPLAVVVPVEGRQLSSQDLLEFLRPRVSSWQLPDDVVFVQEIPKTSVGKFSKKTLREKFSDHQLS